MNPKNFIQDQLMVVSDLQKLILRMSVKPPQNRDKCDKA